MAHKIIERIEARYEAREVPFGKVYEWHSAYVAIECDCGEQLVLTAASTTLPPARAVPVLAASSTTSKNTKTVCRTASLTPGSMILKLVHSNGCCEMRGRLCRRLALALGRRVTADNG